TLMADEDAPPLHGPAATAPQAPGRNGANPYVRTWIRLLVLTILELLVVFLPIPRIRLVVLLVVLAVMKGVLIMAEFMHPRFEKLSFVYSMLSPLLLALALLADRKSVV